MEILDLLKVFVTKLKKNAIFKTHFVDIRRVSKATWSGEISLENTHALILGATNNYSSVIDLDIIKKVLTELHLRIETISMDNFTVNLELTYEG